MDLDFSPFDDDLLASCGEDGLVKLWKITQDSTIDRPPNVLKKLSGFEGSRIETIQYHPTVRTLLSASAKDTVRLWDVESGNTLYTCSAQSDTVQSISWKKDGSSFIYSAKDGSIGIWDPRIDSNAPVQNGTAHSKNRSSRVLWLGSKDLVFTTGFNRIRQREYALYDLRVGLKSSLLKEQMESTSGVLMPLYDEDTNTIYFTGRGDNMVKWLNLSDSIPYLTSGEPVLVDTNAIGFGMLPKRCLNVMKAEISRLLFATPENIIPISFNVPRKSYLDFHEELYPETKSSEPAYSLAEWTAGISGEVSKLSLNPVMGNLIHCLDADTQTMQGIKVEPETETIKLSQTSEISKNGSSKSPHSPKDEVKFSPEAAHEKKTPKRSPLPNLRVSPYRYIFGKPRHITENFEDIKNVFNGLSAESNVLEGNRKFLAYPFAGPGGRVAVLNADDPGRVNPVINTIVAGSEICDFAMSKISTNLVLTASEDGNVRLWKVPEEGLKGDMSHPDGILKGHLSKVHNVFFHPFIEGIATSTSVEQLSVGGQTPTVRIWDIEYSKEKIFLDKFEDYIQGCVWSCYTPSIFAASSKDKIIKIFDARSAKLTGSTASHDGVRATRLFFINDQYLASVGFGKGSMREINLYDLKNLGAPMSTFNLDSSPSILVPHYDENSSVVYLCGKGDTCIRPVEISPSQSNPFYALPRFDSPSGSVQQGCSPISTKYLDMEAIEVSRFWRLTQNNIEPISFSVPRNRREFFQDDLYPLCWDDEHACLKASEWFMGLKDAVPRRCVDLCPKDKTKLSAAPAEKKEPPKYALASGELPKTETERQEQFLNSVFQNARDEQEENEPLPQDLMEGVDSDEWDDY